MPKNYSYRTFCAAMWLYCAFVSAFSQADSILIDLPAQSWYAAPNTQMREVCPPYIYDFSNTCSTVITDWNGGTFDTKRNRMIIWGGGHNSYYQNEIYAFDLNTMQWELLTKSSPPAAYNSTPCIEVLSDGAPNSRHTYDGLAYIEHVDRMFVYGGSLSCGSGDFSTLTWTFDFATKTWNNMKPSGENPEYGYGVITAYDSASKLVYVHDLHNLYTYDFDKNHYTRVSDTFYNDNERVGAIDTKRRLLVIMGLGDLWYYDIGNQDYARRKLATTGETAIINADAPGLKYDPVADRLVAWSGGRVHSLNLDTKVWTSVDVAGKPQNVPESGNMFGRWQFIPKYNVFIAVTDVDDNVHFYKNTPGSGFGTSVDRNDNATKVPRTLHFSVYPNPIRPGSTMYITISNFLEDVGEARLSIFNLNGQLIKQFGSLAALTHYQTIALTWNGQDDAGRPLTSGSYVFVLKTKEAQHVQPFVLMK